MKHSLKHYFGLVIVCAFLCYFALLALDGYYFNEDYHNFLTLVVPLLSLYISYFFHMVKKDSKIKWTFIVIAALFNPIFTVHFDGDTWRLVDLIVACLSLVALGMGRHQVMKVSRDPVIYK